MSTEPLIEAPKSRFQRISNLLVAVAVFINVVLRYGFGCGVPARKIRAWRNIHGPISLYFL